MSSDTRSALVGFAFGFGAAIAAVVLSRPRMSKKLIFDDERPIIRVRNRRLEFVAEADWKDDGHPTPANWILTEGANTDSFLVRIDQPNGTPDLLAGRKVEIESTGPSSRKVTLHATRTPQGSHPKVTPANRLTRDPANRRRLLSAEEFTIEKITAGGCSRSFPGTSTVEVTIVGQPK
jgi:hypothetical protein